MTISIQQKKKAEEFQKMHHDESFLILPNIWDAGSGRIIEKNGFKAMAPTSAGIAFSNGYSDGEHFPFDLLLDSINRISTRTTLPLSVDFERGYSETSKGIYENTKKLLLAGAIGLNIEDGLPSKRISEPNSMKEKLNVLNTLKTELELNFLINSRTDMYWNEIGNENERLAETIDRTNQYFSWGADCVFVPGNIPFSELEILIKEAHGPINVLLNNELRDAQKLKNIGVKRLSLGSNLSRNNLFNLSKQSLMIKNLDFDLVLAESFSYNYLNNLFHD